MDEKRINKLLPFVNSEPLYSQNREGWVIASCPFAPWRHDKGIDKNPSFGINIKDHSKSMYNCFSCASHGDLDDLMLELGRYLKEDKIDGYDLKPAMQLIADEEEDAELDIPDYEEEQVKHDVVVTWPEPYLDGFFQITVSQKAMSYLLERNVPESMWADLDLRYDTKRKRVCFPIRDWDGFLAGFHGRAVMPDTEPKYLVYKWQDRYNKIVWYGEHWLDLEMPVILVESVFDLTSVYRVYRNVACSLSAGMGKAKVERMSGALDIISLYDYGKGGDAARASLDKYLPDSVIRHLKPTEAQGDPGAMDVAEIMELLEPYIEFDEILA